MQRETVAEESSVSGPPADLDGCRQRQTHSRRDVLGCSRKEKNGSTTSKNKTVTTRNPEAIALPNPYTTTHETPRRRFRVRGTQKNAPGTP